VGQTVSRSEAREVAVRVIFGGKFDDETIELALDGRMAGERESQFINKILAAARDSAAEIDGKISGHLKDFTIERLNRTDLACCRAAVAEMTVGETPKQVIINEAVAIAKKYGTAGSGNFVNGILAKIAE
jgi:N utilization substance protein B